MADESNQAWGGLPVSIMIVGNNSIDLQGVGTGNAGSFDGLEPLTGEQATAACEAMVQAFAETHDDLEVVVGNGGVDLVHGSASQGCTPV